MVKDGGRQSRENGAYLLGLAWAWAAWWTGFGFRSSVRARPQAWTWIAHPDLQQQPTSPRTKHVSTFDISGSHC